MKGKDFKDVAAIAAAYALLAFYAVLGAAFLLSATMAFTRYALG